jgi:hypothetical protein
MSADPSPLQQATGLQADQRVTDQQTTVGPDKPPKYPTTYYSDYMIWYQKRNYDVLNDAQQAAD